MSKEIILEHDGQLDIATGKHRYEKIWKNKEWYWSDFVARVSETHYTAETHKEYMTANKKRQDEIKDVGGFVGGYLDKGRRKKLNVVHRQLLTLDIDFGTKAIWSKFKLLFDNAACIYSTHKHTPESPRLRLLIPLDQPYFADECEAIARKIAGMLDIEVFDTSTFQAERLMYWPSTSEDGEYYFRYQDGPFVDGERILSMYRDWRDTTQWPISERLAAIVRTGISKQGDPLEKDGVIGGFCRTHSISDVIEKYLSDVYEPCDIEDRYSYVEGSTSGGLIVYDDKFAYSHHGTDPISGKLCNAFDLVRIHKFGLRDEDAKEGCPVNKLPSYLSMMDYATKDKAVRKQLGSEKLKQLQTDFDDAYLLKSIVDDDVPEKKEPVNNDWAENLEVDRKGNFYGTHANIKLIIENDPKLKGAFAYDAFRNRKLVMKNLPWRKVKPEDKYLTDEDEFNLTIYLSTAYDILNRANTKEVLDTHIIANKFHPIRDYLDTLSWDGMKRAESVFVDYMGAEDTPYTRTVTRKTLVAAVARVFEPGCKFDHVLTLVGAEGKMKSSLLGKLGREWFSDSFNFNMLKSKEAYEQIQGFWIIEIAELVGLRKAEQEAAKNFISKQSDSFRAAYARNLVTLLRQNIFVASSNKKQFLQSAYGNRRWWGVEVGVNDPTKHVFKDLTAEEVAQIWAEVMVYYMAGETLYLDEQMENVARAKQQYHTEQDERIGAIVKYLETGIPENWEEKTIYQRRAYLQGEELEATFDDGDLFERDCVCVAELWCELFGGTLKDMNKNNTKDLHQIMQELKGWESAKSPKRFKLYGPQRAYMRVLNPVEKLLKKAFNAENK
jgi:putative DNA primase/helicase